MYEVMYSNPSLVLGGILGILLPVVDLRVEVTVEDVIEGKQSSSWEYPAWIARR